MRSGPQPRQTVRSTVVCDRLNLDIPAGEWWRCSARRAGKTSLLRIIGRARAPRLGQRAFPRRGCDVRRHARAQRTASCSNYALFGHMTIFENVAFGCGYARKRPGCRSPSSWPKALRCSSSCKLTGSPTVIRTSFGRAAAALALARALAVEPQVAAAREPFGRWDAKGAQGNCGAGYAACTTKMHVTSVFVTTIQERRWRSPRNCSTNAWRDDRKPRPARLPARCGPVIHTTMRSGDLIALPDRG